MAKRSVAALAVGILFWFAHGVWAANLNITETNSGVVFAGDGNFTQNDWLGLISATQTGTELGSMSANLSNPNGHTGIDIIRILDLSGALSDVLTLSYTGGATGVFSATFCSMDSGQICSSAGFTQTAFENAAGNFAFGTSLDPNMSINGNSDAPEPATLALLGVGLAGLAFRRRANAK